MDDNELIETLRQFNEKKVEQLPENARRLFYAIMKICDERDLYKSILKEIKSFIEVDLKKRSDFEIEPKTANYLLEKIGGVLKD